MRKCILCLLNILCSKNIVFALYTVKCTDCYKKIKELNHYIMHSIEYIIYRKRDVISTYMCKYRKNLNKYNLNKKFPIVPILKGNIR